MPILERDLGLDSLRCYATGWSNGGYATWDLIMLRPDLYAAAVAISGAGDTSHAYRFVNIPVWAFHSGDDDVVPYSGTQTMIDKLAALGGTPKLTNTNGWKHFAYAPAWQTADLVPWLFSKTKGNAVAVAQRHVKGFRQIVPVIYMVSVGVMHNKVEMTIRSADESGHQVSYTPREKGSARRQFAKYGIVELWVT